MHLWAFSIAVGIESLDRCLSEYLAGVVALVLCLRSFLRSRMNLFELELEGLSPLYPLGSLDKCEIRQYRVRKKTQLHSKFVVNIAARAQSQIDMRSSLSRCLFIATDVSDRAPDFRWGVATRPRPLSAPGRRKRPRRARWSHRFPHLAGRP